MPLFPECDQHVYNDGQEPAMSVPGERTRRWGRDSGSAETGLHGGRPGEGSHHTQPSYRAMIHVADLEIAIVFLASDKTQLGYIK